jgi:lipopolysaccharide transport system ATP-binding protein
MLSMVGEVGLAVRRPRAQASAGGGFRWAHTLPLTGGSIVARIRRWFEPAEGTTTIFHITHHKAGSQWVNRILHTLAFDRLVPAEAGDGQFLDRPIVPGKIYPTVYVTREQFEAVRVPKNSRWFVVIRDLRDTLISGYFSIKHSHAMEADEDLQLRARLRTTSFEDGLIHLLECWLPDRAAVQQSWAGGPADVLKYEDMLVQDVEILERVLLSHCRLGVPAEKFREVVLANRFEARAGRKPGQEDVASHERKGIAGDWKNHFTDRIAKAFNDRYGALLVKTGYSVDDRW